MAYIDAGTKIREVRKARGMSQDELAELASLNRVTVTKYESGRVEPGAQALARIADALEVSADELLGRTEENEEKEEDEVMQIREQLRRDPNTRLLFNAARNANPEHIRAAAEMLKALKPTEGE